MTKRMLIDATHAEETRVVVLDGNRLDDFDVEVASKKQLKGNIYLAKVIRVEPSLQAAFVEYGGGRHGFLAFSEIHPDYYQIPVADRQRLIALQAEEARAAEADEDEADERALREPAGDEETRPRIVAAALSAGLANPVEAEASPGGAEAALPEPEPEAGNGPEEPALAPEPAPAPAPTASDPDADADAPGHGSTRAQPASIPRDEVFGPEIGGGDAGTEPGAASQASPAHSGDLAPYTAPPYTTPEPDAPTPAEAEQVTRTVEDPPEPPPAPGSAEQQPEPSAEAMRALPPEAAAHAEDEEPAVEPDPEDSGVATDFDIPDLEQPPPETIGGGDTAAEEAGADEARVRRTSRLLRSYRIQEVIHRRQIMLVQVVKEERGTKGAALTTYISLAGRFSVLMPNSPRGGGISRKITSAADRKRLREVTAELNLPEGMGLIVRTAGANRPKPEIKRDCEYLMRLWDDIREHTFRSVAPALIYEEASLIKRAIRDVYSRDIDEIVVDGEEGWRAAHDFMRMLMPSHARKVQLWRGGADGQPGQSLFSKHQVEAQLDAMMSPSVPLKSGGYLVINQTEALVAVDVNSGRSTRERNIEETALRTNLEAADEAARQLRLRDLAGLIVIDFIDMESRKHNAAVERRLKDALRIDRARIQVGSISHFGLLEMSRQRLRPSLAETNFEPCPHCGGTGHVRNVDSSAIHVLRAVEEEGARQRAAVVMVHASGPVVMYLLNHKRERLAEIEQRFSMRVQFAIDDQLGYGECRIDKVRGREELPGRPAATLPVVPAAPADLAEEDTEYDEADEAEDREPAPAAAPDADPAAVAAAEEGERRRRRRRRRRGGRRDGQGAEGAEAGGAEGAEAGGAEGAEAGGAGEDALGLEGADEDAEPEAMVPGDPGFTPVEGIVALDRMPSAEAPEFPAGEAARTLAATGAIAAGAAAGDDQPSIDPSELDENGLPRAGRRRGRRGGRRRRREGEEDAPVAAEAEAAPAPSRPMPPYPGPAYVGPTPADPFGAGFDIFDVIDTAAEVRPRREEPAVSTLQGPVPDTGRPVPETRETLETKDMSPHATTQVFEGHPGAPAQASDREMVPPPVPLPPPSAAPQEATTQVFEGQPFPSAPDHPKAAAEPEAAMAAEPPVAVPQIAPPIQPVLIGSADSPPAERKRGWWRR